MDRQQVEDYILGLPGTQLEYPFGKRLAVYKTNGDMLALMVEDSDPLQLSLKCDPQLAVLLRQKYETVMPAGRLNKKYWNTLLLTGQLPWPEVQGLIRHSYELLLKS
jgi:predicted DNA-binding protein (MmcQ/YjbR family)